MQYQNFGVVGVTVGISLIGGVAQTCPAQDDVAPMSPNSGALHFELGGEWTSAYYFRGLLQEDNGFIFQNWLDLTVDAAEIDGSNLTANFGIWNSVHGETDTAGITDDFLEHIYETDLYAGLGLEVESWNFGVTYIVYTSPSDAFSTIGEIDLSAGYDDSDLWDNRFALNPSATLAIEVDDTGGSEDSYLELGVAPGLSQDFGETTIDFEFPVTVGLGVDDYYIDSGGDDELFGYLRAGADASMPLGVPERFGAWTLNAGVDLLFLGDAAKDVNNGDDFEVVGRLGVSLNY